MNTCLGKRGGSSTYLTLHLSLKRGRDLTPIRPVIVERILPLVHLMICVWLGL
jgi:hypothetical protein